MGRLFKWLVIGVVILVVIGIAAGNAGPRAERGDGDTGSADGTDTANESIQPSESNRETDEDPELGIVSPGEAIVVDDAVRITVDQVEEAEGYGDFSEPAEGNIYIQAFVTYEALEDGVAYNPFDWQVFVDDTAVENFTFVGEGPEPTLGSGNLTEGRKAEGWLIYEVPAAGEVILSYKSPFDPTDSKPAFEVRLRES